MALCILSLPLSSESIGSFDVLVCNVFALSLSSFVATCGHLISGSRVLVGGIVVWLSVVFLGNQVLESFSKVNIAQSPESGSTLACLYVHMSHLIFCTALLLICNLALASGSDDFDLGAVPRFAVLYWHLVELVWIIVLIGLACI